MTDDTEAEEIDVGFADYDYDAGDRPHQTVVKPALFSSYWMEALAVYALVIGLLACAHHLKWIRDYLRRISEKSFSPQPGFE